MNWLQNLVTDAEYSFIKKNFVQKLCSEHESLILFISIPLGAGMMDVSVKIHLLSVQLAWVILFIRTKRLYLRKSLGDNNSQLSSA